MSKCPCAVCEIPKLAQLDGTPVAKYCIMVGCTYAEPHLPVLFYSDCLSEGDVDG